MGRLTVQILLGSLSLPGDGIVRITLLTQVKSLGAGFNAQAEVYLSFLSFFTCVSSSYYTISR